MATDIENHFYVSGLFAAGGFFVWLRKQGGGDTVRYIAVERGAVLGRLLRYDWRTGHAGSSVYAMSKAAVASMVQNIALDLAPRRHGLPGRHLAT